MTITAPFLFLGDVLNAGSIFAREVLSEPPLCALLIFCENLSRSTAFTFRLSYSFFTGLGVLAYNEVVPMFYGDVHQSSFEFSPLVAASSHEAKLLCGFRLVKEFYVYELSNWSVMILSFVFSNSELFLLSASTTMFIFFTLGYQGCI